MTNPDIILERDIVGTEPEAHPTLVLGVIGHEDADDAYSIGKDGGPILARVQLFSGRDYTKTLKPERMQGHEILARITSGVSGLPPKGTEVLVAFPDGMATAPGAGIVIAVLSRVQTTATYGNLAEGELCIHPGSADAVNRLLMKQTGLISLFTRQGNTQDGKGIAIVLDAMNDTISIVNSVGNGIIISPTDIKITAKGSAIVLHADGTANITGKGQVQVDGATVVLGSTVVPVVNAALKGPSGLTGVASLKVLIE